VLRIRDVYSGSQMFIAWIQNLDFSNPDPGCRICIFHVPIHVGTGTGSVALADEMCKFYRTLHVYIILYVSEAYLKHFIRRC
jgi:hypothetical protein